VTELRRFVVRHPEWPWALAAAGAWAALLLGAHPQHSGHAMAMPMPEPHGPPDLARWSLMVVAAMVPAALPAARAVGLEGLWRRRRRGPALFLTVYASAWIVFGAIALATWTALGSPGIAPAVLLAAGAWELTVIKRRSLKACHRVPALAPRGRAADAACVRLGGLHARACIISCGPMMLAMVPRHSLPLMVALTALSTWERFAVRPRLKACALALVALSAIVAA
jgi:predicted metal-binding membrane protein